MIWVDTDKVQEELRELANRDVQSRRWLASSGPEISSFTEAVSGLFDDSGLGDALDQGGVVYSPAADRLLRELETAIRRVNSSRSPAQVIADKEMETVRSLAARALALIEALPSRPS
jgi:hypothetical protein